MPTPKFFITISSVNNDGCRETIFDHGYNQPIDMLALAPLIFKPEPAIAVVATVKTRRKRVDAGKARKTEPVAAHLPPGFEDPVKVVAEYVGPAIGEGEAAQATVRTLPKFGVSAQ